VLTTTHDDWVLPEMIAGYRSKYEAEFYFWQMKALR
jgi:hypothetical protein